MMSIYRYSLLAATLLPLIGCNQSVVTEPSVSLEASAASIKTTDARPIQVIQLCLLYTYTSPRD